MTPIQAPPVISPEEHNRLLELRTGSNSDTVFRLHQLREQLSEAPLLIKATKDTVQQRETISEKKCSISTLLKLTKTIKLQNDSIWLRSLQEKLAHMMSENLGEHLISYKSMIKNPTQAESTPIQKQVFH